MTFDISWFLEWFIRIRLRFKGSNLSSACWCHLSTIPFLKGIKAVNRLVTNPGLSPARKNFTSTDNTVSYLLLSLRDSRKGEGSSELSGWPAKEVRGASKVDKIRFLISCTILWKVSWDHLLSKSLSSSIKVALELFFRHVRIYYPRLANESSIVSKLPVNLFTV